MIHTGMNSAKFYPALFNFNEIMSYFTVTNYVTV
jgi:hypothetical protein